MSDEPKIILKVTKKVNLFDIVKRKIERYKLLDPLDWIKFDWNVSLHYDTLVLKLGRLSYKPTIKFVRYPSYLFIYFYRSENDQCGFKYYVDETSDEFIQVEDTFRYNNLQNFKKMYKENRNDIFKILVNGLKNMDIVTSELTFNKKE